METGLLFCGIGCYFWMRPVQQHPVLAALYTVTAITIICSLNYLSFWITIWAHHWTSISNISSPFSKVFQKKKSQQMAFNRVICALVDWIVTAIIQHEDDAIWCKQCHLWRKEKGYVSKGSINFGCGYLLITKNTDSNPDLFPMSSLILMITRLILDPIGQWRDNLNLK